MSKSQTPRTLIELAESRFDEAGLYYGHGTDNPESEAFYLVMCALGLDFNCDEAHLDKPLSEKQLGKLESLIERRIKQRMPVAYLVNQAWFAGHAFYVDQRVLIPRSPVAELIHARFRPWVEPNKVKRILDVGTGSACIPIACAYAFPDAEVDAVDIDRQALAVARKNVELHDIGEQVQLYLSDLFDQLPNNKYDIIISNPPYVSREEMQTLPPEYQHEPGHALEAEDNGLALVDRILRQAADYLGEQGILVVEVGNSMDAVIERYPELPFTWLEFEYGGEGVFLLNRSDLC